MFIIQHKIIYFVKSILYGKSQYVLGENVWNDLPLDINSISSKEPGCFRLFKLLLFNHLPNKVPINVSFNARWSWCVVAASLQDHQTFLLPTGSRLGHTQKALTDKLEI